MHSSSTTHRGRRGKLNEQDDFPDRQKEKEAEKSSVKPLDLRERSFPS